MACMTHRCDSCGNEWSENRIVYRCSCGSTHGESTWDEGGTERWLRPEVAEFFRRRPEPEAAETADSETNDSELLF